MDENLNGQWNNPEQIQWMVTGNIKSISNTDYSQVTLKLTAYNSQNQLVGENITTKTINNGFGTISVVIPVTKSTGSYNNMTVLNATQNTASDTDISITKKKEKNNFILISFSNFLFCI